MFIGKKVKQISDTANGLLVRIQHLVNSYRFIPVILMTIYPFNGQSLILNLK